MEPEELDRYHPILQTLIENFGGRLKCVILFSSQARGESGPESDHDLFVVISDLPRDPVKRSREVRMTLLPILDRIPGPVGFIPKTPEEVDQNLTPLLLDVFIDGICLYGEAYFEPYHQRVRDAVEQAGLKRKRIGDTWVWRFPRLPKGEWEISWEGYYESS